MSDKNYRLYTGPMERAKAVSTLRGIIQGINLDKIHSELELQELKLWVNAHIELFTKKPLDELGILINNALADNILSQEEIKDILWFCDNLLEGDLSYFDRETQEIQSLHGLMHGILADGIIKDDEILELNNWLDRNTELEALYPYDELKIIISNVFKNGSLDEDEKLILKTFFVPFTHLNNERVFRGLEQEIDEVYEIKGYCAIDPNITFPNHHFCLTGNFVRTKKDEIRKIILAAGGTEKNGLSSKTDYLIVGTNGNPCWTYSSYGRKVEDAVKLRKEGQKIQIIHEDDFWKVIDDLKPDSDEKQQEEFIILNFDAETLNKRYSAYRLGQDYKNAGKYELAIDAYIKYAEVLMDRDKHMPHLWISELYDKLGNGQFSLEHKEKYAKGCSFPKGATLFKDIGNDYLKLNNIPKAIECFEQALERNPKIGVKTKLAALLK